MTRQMDAPAVSGRDTLSGAGGGGTAAPGTPMAWVAIHRKCGKAWAVSVYEEPDWEDEVPEPEIRELPLEDAKALLGCWCFFQPAVPQ